MWSSEVTTIWPEIDFWGKTNMGYYASKGPIYIYIYIKKKYIYIYIYKYIYIYIYHQESDQGGQRVDIYEDLPLGCCILLKLMYTLIIRICQNFKFIPFMVLEI